MILPVEKVEGSGGMAWDVKGCASIYIRERWLVIEK